MKAETTHDHGAYVRARLKSSVFFLLGSIADFRFVLNISENISNDALFFCSNILIFACSPFAGGNPTTDPVILT